MAYDKEFMAKFHDMECLICEAVVGIHGSHVKSQGASRICLDINVYPSCSMHHRLFEFLGPVRMSNKFPVFKEWLINNGWELNSFGKYMNPEIEKIIIERGRGI